MTNERRTRQSFSEECKVEVVELGRMACRAANRAGTTNDERPVAPEWFSFPATTELPMGTPAKVRSLGENGSPYGFAIGHAAGSTGGRRLRGRARPAHRLDRRRPGFGAVGGGPFRCPRQGCDSGSGPRRPRPHCCRDRLLRRGAGSPGLASGVEDARVRGGSMQTRNTGAFVAETSSRRSCSHGRQGGEPAR